MVMWIMSTKASDFQASVQGISWNRNWGNVILFLTTESFDSETLQSIS